MGASAEHLHHSVESLPQAGACLGVVEDHERVLGLGEHSVELVVGHLRSQEARAPSEVAPRLARFNHQARLAGPARAVEQTYRDRLLVVVEPLFERRELSPSGVRKERDELVLRVQRGRRAHLRRSFERPWRQDALPSLIRRHVRAEKRDQTLSGGSCCELLEVVVLVEVAEVHRRLHHDLIDIVKVRNRTDSGGLHLDAEDLPVRAGQLVEDLRVTNHIVPGRDRTNVRTKVRLRREPVRMFQHLSLDELATLRAELDSILEEELVLPKPFERRGPICASHQALGVAERILAPFEHFEHPPRLELEWDGAVRQPLSVRRDDEVLGRVLPRCCKQVRRCLRLEAPSLERTDIIRPQLVRDDHVAEIDVTASTRAHATHGNAARLVLREQRRHRGRGCNPTHFECTGQRDSQDTAVAGAVAAERDAESGRPGTHVPFGLDRAGVDLECFVVFVFDRGDDDDVDAVTWCGARQRSGSIPAFATLQSDEARARV